MEVYIDNMLVKSREAKTHLADLQEAFDILRRYKMKFNPTKCLFGVSSGKFLSFMVSQQAVETNQKKFKAILDMASPKTVKEGQRLTVHIAALNKFVSKATNKCLPFFKVLKQVFQWMDECEAAFQNLKEYLAKPPLLSPSVEGEDLFL